MLIGAHLSIAGGVLNAFKEAESLDIKCFQIFLGSPQVWACKKPAANDVNAFKERMGEYDFVVCHAPYLINLASGDNSLFSKSVHRVTEDMNVMTDLGIGFYVIHPGSAEDVKAGVSLVREGLAAVLENAPKGVILIENTAGKKNDIGKDLNEIAEIISGFGNRAGVCLDTCHLFASGVDIRTSDDVEKLYRELKKNGLDKKVFMIHANDSKYPLGAYKDRHAHIGKGEIGAQGFFNLLHHSFFKNLPFILETPKESGMDEENIKILTQLYSGKKYLP